jgi:hypothetical protein
VNRLKYAALSAAVAGACFAATVPAAEAQVNISIGGVAPSCPYGYYDAAPYSCAPYGYYGPEWFSGGVFIGAGQWYHGPADFHGHVNNSYDVRNGYKGPVPNRGDRVEPANHLDRVSNFKGNEVRDGRGHVGEDKR